MEPANRVHLVDKTLFQASKNFLTNTGDSDETIAFPVIFLG